MPSRHRADCLDIASERYFNSDLKIHLQEVFILPIKHRSLLTLSPLSSVGKRWNTYYRNDPSEYDLLPAPDLHDFIEE